MSPKKNKEIVVNKTSTELSKVKQAKQESSSDSESESSTESTTTTTTTQSNDSMAEPAYFPILFDITEKSTIFSEEPIIRYSTNLDYPKFSLGFHHFIHASKNKMEILKQFENKKKVYLVMNEFERYVDNYAESIGDTTKKYFSKLGNVPEILSRGFYKLWEILFMHDLIDLKKDKFVSIHLAEGPGSFIQSTMFYRDMYCKQGVSKNDKFYAITLHADNNKDKQIPPELEAKFVEHYEKEKPKRFTMHKTYPKNVASNDKTKDNGDLTNPKTIKLFSENVEKADFITADGGFDWINENIQEQEAFKLILSQIVTAFKTQKKGGHFVCKFFETFTTTSTKLLSILLQIYNKVVFVKPLMSRPSNSEKYAVCMSFKYDVNDKEYKTIMKKMDELMENSHSKNDSSNNIIDIFPDYKVPESLNNKITSVNIAISNNQFKSIGMIVDFVREQNFYGDTYRAKREKQILASQYWNHLFCPSAINDTKDKINNMKTYSMEISEDRYQKLKLTN